MARIASAESHASIFEESGCLRRSFPVCLAYSAKAALKKASKLEFVESILGEDGSDIKLWERHLTLRVEGGRGYEQILGLVASALRSSHHMAFNLSDFRDRKAGVKGGYRPLAGLNKPV
jgi:hypothetical protein